MRNIILFLFLILLLGCSFNDPFPSKEIDQVTVVKYTPYMKYHRIFLSRSNLEIIKNKKYLYLYHTKNNDLAVLVQRENTFFLYTLSNPEQDIYSLPLPKEETYTYALNYFKDMGYHSISSPSAKGFVVTVSHKRYKDIKTLLFEIKDYTRLLKLYKKAIRHYDASRIKNIKTLLPKSLILPYYRYYKKRAKNKKQYEQLHIIADKLQIKEIVAPKKTTHISSTNPLITKKTVEDQKEKTEEHPTWYDFSQKKKEKVIPHIPVIVATPYTHYLNNASLSELSDYLSKRTNRKSLSTSRYLALKQREKKMKEAKLLKEGSLEELITAYKRNNSPKFKQRILSLMKKEQK